MWGIKSKSKFHSLPFFLLPGSWPFRFLGSTVSFWMEYPGPHPSQPFLSRLPRSAPELSLAPFFIPDLPCSSLPSNSLII